MKPCSFHSHTSQNISIANTHTYSLHDKWKCHVTCCKHISLLKPERHNGSAPNPVNGLHMLHVKAIVHPKMNISWKRTHPQAIIDVDKFFFIRTDLEKCSIPSLSHQWILCSEWVPSEWESKQLIKTSK